MVDNTLDLLNTLEDVDNYKSEKQKEHQEMISHRHTVEAAQYEVRQKILDLQLEIKALMKEKLRLDESLSKAKSNCARLAIEIKRANSKFWMMKNV